MSRALITLHSSGDRERAARWSMQAPIGTRIEFKDPKRTNPQNDRMWAMLTDVATQKQHNGRKYTADQWKILFMHGCGRDVQFLPSLDNSTFIPWGQSSSDLSKDEMTNLIEFIFAWGAENNVVFHEPAEKGLASAAPGAAPGIASAAPLNSSEASAPLIPASDDARAVAPGGAGATSSAALGAERPKNPDAVEPKQTSEPGTPALHGSAGLPPDWTTQYAAALKKALKFPALPKHAAAFWKDFGGWDAHRNGPDAETAGAIYRVFEQNFPDHEKRDAILRELGAGE